MRDYAKVVSTFWTRGSGKRLRGDLEAQVVALYLMSCPSGTMTGLYYLPLPTLSHETGIPLEGASKALRRVSEGGLAHYDEDLELVWVPNAARFQVGETISPNDNRWKGVLKELEKFGSHPFVKAFYELYGTSFHLPKWKGVGRPFEAPSKPLRSQEQEQEQDQDQDPPKPPFGLVSGVAIDLLEADETTREQDYQRAYEQGVAKGKGGAYAMPGQQRAELHQAILAHARGGKTGKALRGDRLLEWIGDLAEEFARFVAQHPRPEAVGWYSAFGPKGFLRWLNEQAVQRAEREVG